MVAVWHTPTHPTSAPSKLTAAPLRPAPRAAAEPAAAATAGTATTAQPRGYEDLLDALSEHQLLVFNGRLVQDTPQVLTSSC